ncbi:MAG: response regulator [Desulfonauticus sp.]|nr:response regulator [Desulfonauticus sp.]
MSQQTKVLVIDDDESTLKLFELYLKIFGYQALVAKSGEQGLTLFKEHLPRIVFTDIKMPGMDGIQVLKEVKKIKPDTEVIIVTGHGDFELAVQALSLDATDFLNKPIGKEEIETSLERAKDRLRALENDKKKFEYIISNKEASIRINGSVSVQSHITLKEIWEEVLKAKCKKIEFIFAKSISINGAGLTLFKKIYQNAKEHNIDLKFTDLPKHFQEVFKSIGIAI